MRLDSRIHRRRVGSETPVVANNSFVFIVIGMIPINPIPRQYSTGWKKNTETSLTYYVIRTKEFA